MEVTPQATPSQSQSRRLLTSSAPIPPRIHGTPLRTHPLLQRATTAPATPSYAPPPLSAEELQDYEAEKAKQRELQKQIDDIKVSVNISLLALLHAHTYSHTFILYFYQVPTVRSSLSSAL